MTNKSTHEVVLSISDKKPRAAKCIDQKVIYNLVAENKKELN